jgi:LysR family transcriptional regulator, glycine cleavage system transcriptional activator
MVVSSGDERLVPESELDLAVDEGFGRSHEGLHVRLLHVRADELRLAFPLFDDQPAMRRICSFVHANPFASGFEGHDLPNDALKFSPRGIKLFGLDSAGDHHGDGLNTGFAHVISLICAHELRTFCAAPAVAANDALSTTCEIFSTMPDVNPSPGKLPPLTALPCFEAAARLLSFTKAAEELHLTPGAISRAVKHLEEQIGVQLFERVTRSVRLTEAGEPYAKAVRDMLGQLAAATSAATAHQSGSTLNVSTSDGFAGRWLVPRLYRFHQAHGDIDVRVSTTGRLASFHGDGIDVAIRYGRGDYAGLTTEWLADEEVFPVCSPRLLNGRKALRNPSDLRHHTLIRDGYPIDWAHWFAAAGVKGVNSRGGLTFDSYTFAVQAAVQGEGVALGRTMLVADDLATGRLVRPFKQALKAYSSFYLVYPPQAIHQRKVKAFREWLLAEMGGNSQASQ